MVVMRRYLRQSDFDWITLNTIRTWEDAARKSLAKSVLCDCVVSAVFAPIDYRRDFVYIEVCWCSGGESLEFWSDHIAVRRKLESLGCRVQKREKT